ncbi:MAG: tetratricopeptide repeat protein, partial [bacterium]
SPEMIQNIGNLDKLKQFLVAKHVTYLAVLRNWFEIVNQPALFKTDERVPEIMEVFQFDAERMHVTSKEASYAVGTAAQALYRGQFDAAGQMLQRAIQLDPQNSKAHHLLGSSFIATDRLEDAAREFTVALKLNPDLLESQIGLAQVAARQNRPEDAAAQLETIAQRNPNYPAVYRALSDLYRSFRPDSAKANKYLQRFNQLVSEQQQ